AINTKAILMNVRDELCALYPGYKVVQVAQKLDSAVIRHGFLGMKKTKIFLNTRREYRHRSLMKYSTMNQETLFTSKINLHYGVNHDAKIVAWWCQITSDWSDWNKQ